MCWTGLPGVQFKVSKEISFCFFSTNNNSFIVILLSVPDALLLSSGMFPTLTLTL